MSKRGRIKIVGVTVTVLVTATLLGGCYLLPKEEEPLAPPLLKPAQVSFETTEVQKGDIKKELTVTGRFRSSYEVTASFEKRGGYIQEIYAKYGQEVKEGDPIMDLDIDTLEHNKDQAYYQYKKARLYYDKIKNNGASSYDISIAEIDKKLAYNNYLSAKEELEKGQLVAPISGIITYMSKANVGEYIAARKPVCKIADPGQLYLMVQGEDAYSFKFGDEVSVEINGMSDKVYKGTVIQTPSDRPNNIALDFEDPTVIIDVKDFPKDEVKLNKEARVKLVMAHVEDVITIKRSLVKNYNGRSFVNVLENGVKVERDVELGMSDATRVEIREGLEVGDLVIVR